MIAFEGIPWPSTTILYLSHHMLIFMRNFDEISKFKKASLCCCRITIHKTEIMISALPRAVQQSRLRLSSSQLRTLSRSAPPAHLTIPTLTKSFSTSLLIPRKNFSIPHARHISFGNNNNNSNNNNYGGKQTSSS